MATINEIKNLIKTKIEGQGSQVDIGNGLPSVLNGVADLIQQTQEFIGKGFLFVGCFEENDLPEIPDTDTNQYFAFVWHEESGYFSFMQWEKSNGWDSFPMDFEFQPIITLEDLEAYKRETTPGFYITPKCLVDYAVRYEDFSDYQHGEELSQNDYRRLEGAIVVKYGGTFYSRINAICNTWEDAIKEYWDDQYTPIRIFGSLEYEMQNGVPTLTNVNAVCLAQDGNGKEYFAVVEI